MDDFYPPIEPFRTHFLTVSPIHNLYVEEVGNPQGRPILFLHGGPGSGIVPDHRRLLDPEHYRIILFDQRGSGKSTPFASLEENTTWHLVSDIEILREHLGIKDWIVFGGSWGSTLALVYAETHPTSVTGLILRGIFLCRREEIQWFYQEGCHWLFPDYWEKYLAPIPVEERNDLVAAYYKRLTHADNSVRTQAATAWSGWEGSTLRLKPNDETVRLFSSEPRALSLARIECHYFVNHCFFPEDNFILNNVSKIQNIPGVIIHGRYDVVCPVKNAWDLHRAWPQAPLHIIDDAGHAYNEPGILKALVKAAEDFKRL